jgi:hypothetical protein
MPADRAPVTALFAAVRNIKKVISAKLTVPVHCFMSYGGLEVRLHSFFIAAVDRVE